MNGFSQNADAGISGAAGGRQGFWRDDVLALIFLCALAGVLYFAQAGRLGLSQDGFLLTYLLHLGDLFPYNIHEVKEPGRPFVGLGWWLAAWMGGGSVTGYNIFMFACLLASSALVYVLIRTLIPKQPVWGFLAGALKLAWGSNYQVFTNHSLAIYFAEVLFWLACCLIVLLMRPPQDAAAVFRPLGLGLMSACLVVVTGTYQTAWPLILLVPPMLMVLGGIQITAKRQHYIVLSTWYLPALLMMGWCFFLSRQFIAQTAPVLSEVLDHWTRGLWAATFQSLWVPFAAHKAYPTAGMSGYVILSIGVFAVLLAWMGVRSWPSLQAQPRGRLSRVLVLMLFAGLVIMAVTLLPPSLKYIPMHGTRFMHWPALGLILASCAALAWLYRMHRLVGGVISAVMAIALFAGMAQQTYSVGNHYGENGFHNRRFWEDVSMGLPKISEGTVVLMDGPPRGIATSDYFSTWVLRGMTDTHLTFFVTDARPKFDKLDRVYEVSSRVDLDQSLPLVKQHNDYRAPRVYKLPQTYRIPAERVIWVEWDWQNRRLHVVPERSAMGRLQRNATSVYGERLFPTEASERNRNRSNTPPL